MWPTLHAWVWSIPSVQIQMSNPTYKQQATVHKFIIFFIFAVFFCPRLNNFLPVNLIPPALLFSSESCFMLTSQERKCFVWYLSVKRSAAGLPSLITHHHVRLCYMKQAQEWAKNMVDRETEKENMHTPPKRQATEIPSAVIVIKVNWLQLAG